MSISKKIDFAVVLTVKNANPNGDPLNGNRPRVNYDGLGEISDVCIKRKIRNRIMRMSRDGEKGQDILVQSDDNRVDEFTSIKARIDASGLKTESKDFKQKACAKWFDVRAFGQIFPFKGKTKGEGVSIPVRGPVSVHPAFSIEPVTVSSIQITKSTNLEDTKDGKRGADTMGMKHRVDQGTYVFYGSINAQLASDETGTGFSDNDAKQLKEALRTMFENDVSSARPDGSMAVEKLVWWEHSCPSGDVSSAKVHGKLANAMETGAELTKEALSLNYGEQSKLIPEIVEGF